MSRGLTPQERAEYERKRRRSLEETAARLGMTPEELEQLEQEARRGENRPQEGRKASAEAALRAALEKVANGFLDGLKTENQREALDTAGDIDGMSEEEFSTLLARRMSVLDEEERTEAGKSIARTIDRWDYSEGNPLSLREEILLGLQAMIRRRNYYAER